MGSQGMETRRNPLWQEGNGAERRRIEPWEEEEFDELMEEEEYEDEEDEEDWDDEFDEDH